MEFCKKCVEELKPFAGNGVSPKSREENVSENICFSEKGEKTHERS